MATWRHLRQIAKTLPELAEEPGRQWRVQNKMVVWERPLRKSDITALGENAPRGHIIGIRVADEGVKFALVSDSPHIFFTTPHFDGHPVVLARLAEIDVEELRELVTDAWLERAPKKLSKQWLAENSPT